MRYLVVVFIFLLTSCGSSRIDRGKKKLTTSTERSEVQKDSLKTTIVNNAIDDKLTIPVTKSNTNDKRKDSLINAKVDEILSKLNINKRSGDNGYRLYYDLEKRLIELQATIGQTEHTNTEVNSSEKTEKTFEEKTDEYLSKKISNLPWWVYLIAVIYFLPKLIERLQFVYNPIAGIIKMRKPIV